jgi:hypothetical protein
MINVMFSVLGCHLSPDLLVFPENMLLVELRSCTVLTPLHLHRNYRDGVRLIDPQEEQPRRERREASEHHTRGRRVRAHRPHPGGLRCCPSSQGAGCQGSRRPPLQAPGSCR